MKVLRIAGIFILVITLFGAIIYFMGGTTEEQLPPEEVKHYREKIDEKWSGVIWSDSIFENVIGYIGRHRAELRGSYNTLLDYNSETAIQHINEALMNEFHQRNCSTRKVEEYYAGVKYLLNNDADHAINDSRINKLKKTYTLYTDIEKFCNRNIRLTSVPTINLDSSTIWNPQFKKYRNGIMSTITGFKSNPCYAEIQSITRFQEFFNSVSSKLDDAELAYMKIIYNLIIEANVTNSNMQIRILNQFKEDFETIISHNSNASNMVRNLTIKYN